MKSSANFAREMQLVFAPDKLWPGMARELAAFARRDRDRRITAGTFTRGFQTFVNGIEDEREEAVKPAGVIVYRARLLGLAVVTAIEELRRRAPAGTGPPGMGQRYRDSFMVGVSRGGAEGQAIPWDSFSPDRVSTDATEAFIYSPLPYSRKLDVQMIGQRPIQVSVPAGFFAAAAQAVRRRFPTMDARRLYTIRHPQAERREDGQMIEYPALVINERHYGASKALVRSNERRH